MKREEAQSKDEMSCAVNDRQEGPTIVQPLPSFTSMEAISQGPLRQPQYDHQPIYGVVLESPGRPLVQHSLPCLQAVLPASILALLPSSKATSPSKRPLLSAIHLSQPSSLPYQMNKSAAPKAKSRRGRKPVDPNAGAVSPRTRQRNRRARVKAEKEEEKRQDISTIPEVLLDNRSQEAYTETRRSRRSLGQSLRRIRPSIRARAQRGPPEQIR
jgi:hypothetical protein